MKQNLFTNLPPEILIEILSRLSVVSIIRCKCVCKSWLDLVESREFGKSQLSKSVPYLAVFQDVRRSKPYQFFEFAEDELDPEHRFNAVFNFTFPHTEPTLRSSVNGLLFLCGQDRGKRHQNLFVCNPITRDFIMLPSPDQEPEYEYKRYDTFGFGFGVSKMRDQYKIVRVFSHCSETKCEVYTLGTGTWRSIAAGFELINDIGTCYNGVLQWLGAFVNGNIHWLVVDPEGDPRICCFDVETEVFSTFSSPPTRPCVWNLTALVGCLCLCDNLADNQIVIWLMKEYGDEKSWTKEFLIGKTFEMVYTCKWWEFHFPVKVFKDGDILIAGEEVSPELYCYSNKTRTFEWIEVFEMYKTSRTSKIIYTPSFLPLKTLFVMENVCSF